MTAGVAQVFAMPSTNIGSVQPHHTLKNFR